MRKALMLCCSVALLGMFTTAGAQDWTKSKWGPNDEIGAANNMSPEIVVKAAGSDQDRQDLRARNRNQFQHAGLPSPHLQGAGVEPGQAGGSGLGPSKTTYNDDIIEGWIGIGSQIDGLGHIGVDWTYYNGNKSGDFAAADKG